LDPKNGTGSDFSNIHPAKEFALAFPIGVFNVIGAFQTSAQLVNLDAGCGGKK
jgi:hypothetical protein